MKYLVIAVTVAVLPLVVFGQFKTKTHVASGNLVYGSNSTYLETYGYNSSLYPRVPPPTSSPVLVPRAPVYVDKIAEFLNTTRSQIAPGICFTEVPTTSLVHDLHTVPAGNGSTPQMSRIQICCDGYQRNPHIFRKCDPICKDDCPNGICTAPNTCVCLPGNVRDHEEKCSPTCPIGCKNGMCQPDGSCVCKPGYNLDLTTKQFCRPQCNKGCDFGVCVAPDVCNCLPNYELSSYGVCQPKCDNCLHGTCKAPGLCICDRGYVQQGNSGCQPICDKGCSQGVCIAPNVCSCQPGYQLDATGTTCTPHCDKPCLNGYCDGSNLCSCNYGYVKDELQPNVCKAHCTSGCPNGYCTSPNFCICKPGFIKTGVKGRQTCVPV